MTRSRCPISPVTGTKPENLKCVQTTRSMALKHDDSTFSPTTYATAVIGSGTIGSRIALMLASGGGEVGLYDPNADQLKFREMLFDGSFPQFCSICKLFDDSVLFQFLPAVLEPASFEILDSGFERRNLMPPTSGKRLTAPMNKLARYTLSDWGTPNSP